MEIRFNRGANDLYDSEGKMLASVGDGELADFMRWLSENGTVRNVMCAYLGYVVFANLLRERESPMISYSIAKCLRCR